MLALESYTKGAGQTVIPHGVDRCLDIDGGESLV